jgi:hypothetical protein
MLSKDSYTICKCQPCCENSGGNGRCVTTSQYHIHMAVMRTSAARSTPVARSPPIPPLPQSNTGNNFGARYPLSTAQADLTVQVAPEHTSSVPTHCYADLLDQLSTETFVSTLQDEGTDPATQADKLWTSCAEFQRMSSKLSPTPALPSIGAVTQGMERLSLQTHIPPSTPTPSPPTPQRASPLHTPPSH